MSSNYYGTQRYNSTQISYSSGSYNCPLDMFIDMTPWDIKINTPTRSLQPHSQTYFKSLPFPYCSCIYLFRSSVFPVINYSSPLCLRPIPFPIMLHASRQLMLPSERHRLEVLWQLPFAFGINSGFRLLESESQLYHARAVWPWASHLTSLSLGFLVRKIWI